MSAVRTMWVVQSTPEDSPEGEEVWADEETASTRILGYGALLKHTEHGAPGYRFRLLWRTICEGVIEE